MGNITAATTDKIMPPMKIISIGLINLRNTSTALDRRSE
jgi:hypothetical protein